MTPSWSTLVVACPYVSVWVVRKDSLSWVDFHFQDFLQVLSMFAGFGFAWPPQVVAVYDSFSLLNFNFELLAPECSVSLNFEAKWYIVEALPLILLAGICVVLAGTRVLQWAQVRLLGTLPFGALSTVSLVDVCIGVFISGLFMMYYGEGSVVAASCCDPLSFNHWWFCIGLSSCGFGERTQACSVDNVVRRGCNVVSRDSVVAHPIRLRHVQFRLQCP